MLAESILSGLNGLYIASNALLRPFLEFSLLQNYYYRLVERAAYTPVQDYLEKGRHPSWGTVLNDALPHDSFCRSIRYRLQAHLAGLSTLTIRLLSRPAPPLCARSFARSL